MNDVKLFYDKLQFPGHYTLSGLSYHDPNIRNPYLKIINRHLSNNMSVLDVGCGTGLIANLFARKYPKSKFVGIDFANSIDYAQQFAQTHLISNAQFIKQDISQHKFAETYDVIICQGVLHHIPDYQNAAKLLVSALRPGGKLILGLYHPWGKIAKKIFNINYKNDILFQDQELHPYETTFNLAQVKLLFPNLKLVDAFPTMINTLNRIYALVNSRNGGLTVYILEKSND